MLASEQETSGSHRSTLSAILREFADVLSMSDEDLGQTRVIRHTIHTGDAKPVRCSPRRIVHQDWSKACQSAFEALKNHLTSACILTYPDFHRQFTVDVETALGRS
ncbi:hypothetical protein T07_13536 [Trichinella nelsoni]|uniref:Reverse transcriptase/retrotransposon-derived protein RNase H-like domain-containing protein n=1 Tax=Trichinella nelsoni TaxID=6336 RepID=A0A0V0SFB5_9BILA|nr:hypothetical protein T07_13536 [Trichinella nelsoni]